MHFCLFKHRKRPPYSYLKQKFHVITIKRSKKVSILYVVVALNEETLSRGWISSEKLVALKRDNIQFL